jgi:signal transduction histidine kinase/CheY-like chemotaxis protein/CHASE3 domain sensor protein
MKIRDLKIGTQLFIGLSVLLFFVVALGVISYLQTNKIHDQTDLLYKHPLQVRTAIGEIRTDAYLIHWALETALDKDDFETMMPYLQKIRESEERMQQNFAVLREKYLGSPEDVEALEEVTSQCKINRDRVFSLIRGGEFEQADLINIHKGSVIGGDHMSEIIEKIDKISIFSGNKADALKLQSHELNEKLTNQLIMIVVVFFVLSLLVNFMLLHNIRRPLITLTHAAKRFRDGEMAERSDYRSKNEMGMLSESFNDLADSVQENFTYHEKANHLAGLMLSEDDAGKFFKITLKTLANMTGSQMIAVYLLSNNNKRFEHYYSIGLNESARKSFDVETLEGEFGKAATTGEIQHLTAIDTDARFVFQAVSGELLPSSIITIPVSASGDVVAMISMAAVSKYDQQTVDFVHKMHKTLNARIAGILAYKRMTEFAARLETQNHELETQKNELYQQAAELNQQNAELEMQKKQLDEANRLKTNFLSNMSHELRTPLNSVIALSGVLNRRLSGKIPDDEFSYIGVIERNGKLLLSLINDILDLSRIEAGREETEISQFNVCNCVNEVAEIIRPQAQEKDIKLTTATGDCEVLINSDANKFRHILQNLVGNAVKFTEKGSVDVEVEKKNSTVEVSVIDSGIGIDEAHLAHIFDEFRQADGSTSRKYGGTGLGLAIAKKYANLLGGDINVKSTPGEGSVFKLTLPLKHDDESGMKNTENTASSGFSQIEMPDEPQGIDTDKTILLVEDSEPAVVQMKDILEEAGFTVLVAEDGGRALEMVEHTVPDAIVLDLMMPGIDGFQVLRMIREAPHIASVPVLILTAKHVTKEDLDFLRGNRISQLIRKGDVDRKNLLNTIIKMVTPKKPENTATSAKQHPEIKGRPRILVIEDNQDNMLTVKAMLADDYDVIEAVDGKQGLAMAVRHKPDLILMDIALPGMDGIEAFKAIRKNPALNTTPIVALTASAMTSDREVILAYGFDGYIAKPIDEKIFFSTIKSVLYGV